MDSQELFAWCVVCLLVGAYFSGCVALGHRLGQLLERYVARRLERARQRRVARINHR